MRKIILLLTLGATTLCVTSASAGAGIRVTPIDAFVLDDGVIQVDGALRGVRNSRDPNEYIGCMARAYSDGTTFVNCYAKQPDADGSYYECVLISPSGNPSPSWLAPLGMLDAAHLSFRIHVDGASCLGIAVDTNSLYM